MTVQKQKFLLIGGFASSLINFRGPLLKRLVQDFEVYAAAPFIEDKIRIQVEKIGAKCISTKFERTGLNPIKDLKAQFELRKKILEIRPDFVLAYTIKPVIFGLKSAKLIGVKRFALITGKGSGFNQHTVKAKVVAAIVKGLYRKALKSVDGVIFQNVDDQQFFLKNHIISDSKRSIVIEGTGVDLDYYKSELNRIAPTKVRFLFIARLIKDKGILELVKATELLRTKGYEFQVQLLGWVDPNPGGMSASEINQLHESGLVTYLGTTDDVRPYIESSDVFVLPSYYNEGLPRTIQEAMAMRRPIITTDHPGCRETVDHGVNGFLVKVKDSESLANAMEYFLKYPEKVLEMGEKSYEFAKKKFDVNIINRRLLKFMELTDV